MYACSAAVAHSLHRSRVIGHNSPKLLNELCPHQSTCHFLEFGRSEVVLGVDTVDTYLRRYSWFFAAYLLAIQGPLTDCAPWVVFARPLLPRTVRVIWNLATNGAHPGKTGTVKYFLTPLILHGGFGAPIIPRGEGWFWVHNVRNKKQY